MVRQEPLDKGAFMTKRSLKGEIFRDVDEFCKIREKKEKFVLGESMIQYAGRIYDKEEMKMMIDAVLDFWLTLGRYASKFEKNFSNFLDIKHVLLTNSGSSANLVAMASLRSLQLKNRLKDGDEVITPAATFPTTFNPIIQNNLVPVLLDIELGTYNIKFESLKTALSEKTRAIVIPHTLGNPNEMDAIMDFAEEHCLFVIEDACDALGSRYNGKLVGTFGTFGTFSFYPAHHITMGEGGAVVSNNDLLSLIAKSIRDWGRACVCPICQLNLGHRCPLGFRVSSLAKYKYMNIGYNLKPTDIQAALGVAQLKKLPIFIKKRRRNFEILYEHFLRYEDYFVLPKSLSKADPSWFAFPLTVKDNLKFKRKDIVSWLERCRIETRPLFATNIIRQPAYRDVRYRIAEDLENTDDAMKKTFFIGVYPGIDEHKMNYILAKIDEFIKEVI